MSSDLEEHMDLLQYTSGSTEATLTINGRTETYDVTESPPANSQLVQDAYPKVLQTLTLSTTLKNLDLTADLIYLSYNAVAGTEYSNIIFTAQEALSELTSTVKNEIFYMKDDALDVIDRLNYGFHFLSILEEDNAISNFSRIADIAKKLQGKCGKLTAATGKMRDTLTSLAGRFEDEVADDITKGQKLSNARKKLSEDIKAKQDVLTNLKTTLSRLSKDITDALNQYLKDYGRENLLNAFKVVQKAISMGLGGPLAVISDVEQESQKKKAGNKQSSDQKAGGKQKATSSSENKITPGDLDETKKNAKAAADKMEGIVKKEQVYYEQLRAARLKDEQLAIGAAQKIGELQTLLEFNKNDQTNNIQAQAAIEIGLYCVHNITVQLSNADLFWANLNLFFESVDVSQIENLVRLNRSGSEDERRAEYLGKEFISQGIENIVGWRAVSLICEKLSAASQATFDKIQDNIKSAPSIAEAQAQVDTLNSEVRSLVQKEIEEAKARAASLKEVLDHEALDDKLGVSSASS